MRNNKDQLSIKRIYNGQKTAREILLTNLQNPQIQGLLSAPLYENFKGCGLQLYFLKGCGPWTDTVCDY